VPGLSPVATVAETAGKTNRVSVQQEQPVAMRLATAAVSSVGASALRLQFVRDFAELERLVPAWQALLESSASNEPMLSPTWPLAWWRNYGRAYQLAVGLFYDGDHLAGLAPLLLRRYWHRPGLPFLRFDFLAPDVDEQD